MDFWIGLIIVLVVTIYRLYKYPEIIVEEIDRAEIEGLVKSVVKDGKNYTTIIEYQGEDYVFVDKYSYDQCIDKVGEFFPCTYIRVKPQNIDRIDVIMLLGHNHEKKV